MPSSFRGNLIAPVVGPRSNDTNSSSELLKGDPSKSDPPKRNPSRNDPPACCSDYKRRKCKSIRAHSHKTNHHNYGRHHRKIEFPTTNNENHMKSRTNCIKFIQFRQSNRPASNQPKCDPVHCLIYGHLGCRSVRASVSKSISRNSLKGIFRSSISKSISTNISKSISKNSSKYIFRSISRSISKNGSQIRADRYGPCSSKRAERRFAFERCQACNHRRQMNSHPPHKRCPLNDQDVNKQNAVATLNCDNLVSSPKAALRDLRDPAKEDLNYKGTDFPNGTTSGINNGNAKIERRAFTQSNEDKERNHSENSSRLRASSPDSAGMHRKSVLDSAFRECPAGDYREDYPEDYLNGGTSKGHSNRMNRTSYTTEQTNRGTGNKPRLCSTRPSAHLSEVKRKENLDQKEITAAAAEERRSEDGWRRADRLQSFEQVSMDVSMDDRTEDYGHSNGRTKDRAPTQDIQQGVLDNGKTAQSHLNYLEDKAQNETHLMNPVELVIERDATKEATEEATAEERRTAKQVERLNNQTKYQSKCLTKRSPFKMHLFTDSDQMRISDQKSRENQFENKFENEFEHCDLQMSAMNGAICDSRQIRQEEIQQIQDAQRKADHTCRTVRHPLDHRTASERKATHQFRSEIPYQVSHKISSHKIRHHTNNSRQKSPDSLLEAVRGFLLFLVLMCPHLSANESSRLNFRNQTAIFLPGVNVPAQMIAGLPFVIRDSPTSTAGYNDTTVHQINSINSFESLDLLNSPGTFKPMNSIDSPNSLNSISTISLDVDVRPTLFNALVAANSTPDGRLAKVTTNYPAYLNYASALEHYQNQLALEANSINETNYTSSMYLKDKWFLRFFPDKYVDTQMELSEFLFRLFGVFICSILLCLTLFGNVLTITVVLRFNRMKTVTNILLAR